MKITRCFTVFLFFIWCLAKTLFAQSNHASLLWEISGNGLKKPSYLFGTIHLIAEQDFFFPKYMEKALKKSKKLIMEVDLTDVMGQINVMQLAMLDSGKTLADLYSIEDYEFIRQTAFDSLQMNIERFKFMKPIFVQQQLFAQNVVSGGMKSYELHLLSLAVKFRKQTGGLETADEQLRILDSIPLSAQAAMLHEGLKNIHLQRKQLAKMVQMYKSQNVEGMYQMLAEGEEVGAHADALLANRNRKWIPLIENEIKKQSIFIAVGAGHLGGPDGVIQLLKQRGFLLRPVTR
jgi:uncharacterized protein YbaP (TraB family)